MFWRNGFVLSYGISTIVGYLMPNIVYTYISNVYDLLITFLKSLSSFFLHML